MRDTGPVLEAVVEADGGRLLTIRRPGGSADVYETLLRTPEGFAQSQVYDVRPSLAAYVRDLADAWRGFDGVKSYRSLEGDLELEATHDGRGIVRLKATLRNPSPPEWSFSAVLELGAGAQLDRVAADLEGILK